VYTYHAQNTCVPRSDLRARLFMIGHVDLYDLVNHNPDLRMVPIQYLEPMRSALKQLGYRARIRYRGPHKQQQDTHKHLARAFTVYFKEPLTCML